MKKILLILFLIAALCFTSCGGDDSTDTSDSGTGTGAETGSDTVGGDEGGEEDTLDIWKGVEGDTIEFSVTLAGSTSYVELNRDGSCRTYNTFGTFTGEDYGHPEYDAELTVQASLYGSFEVKSGEVTATMDAQVYYYFAASGKDGDALKDICFESNFSEEHREGYYGKGVVMNESDGTQIVVVNYDGTSYVLAGVTLYDSDGAKVSHTVPNADGSYQSTAYYPNGNTAEIRSYDAEDNLTKLEIYSEEGTFEYAEVVTREEGRYTVTRTDADGNVIHTKETLTNNKKYENGGYRNETTEIENGVTVSHSIFEEIYGADGMHISSYSFYEGVEDGKDIYRESYEDHRDPTNYYHCSKTTVDGVLTEYYCGIERVTEMEGYEKGRQYVTYNPDQDIFSLTIEYVDEFDFLNGIGFDYPADEYVHGEWETFVYEKAE